MEKSATFSPMVCMLALSLAWGHDLVQPAWRGENGTTLQVWTFDDADDPAGPEVIDNLYGSASADITVGLFSSGWLEHLPGMGTQTGFWDIGGDGGSIVIDIDNYPLPLEYKEIWVQVTYYKGFHQAPVVHVPGADYLGGQTEILVEHTPPFGDWLLDQSMWRIEPNPENEQIVLTSHPSMSVIDQIVVDTICVPEPPTAPFDFDRDGDVDGQDLDVFEACATGPAILYDPDNLPPGCPLTPDEQGIVAADQDRDGDVDHGDFGVFQRCISGSGVWADPYCAD